MARPFVLRVQMAVDSILDFMYEVRHFEIRPPSFDIESRRKYDDRSNLDVVLLAPEMCCMKIAYRMGFVDL